MEWYEAKYYKLRGGNKQELFDLSFLDGVVDPYAPTKHKPIFEIKDL